VLIPGFAGFDALGQLEYYAGTTPLFRRWQSGDVSRRRAVLHYFDNFPTAGVTTRAGRLRRYLTKRLVRGEFQPGDAVALVGHSTGGLDIRRLLWDLSSSAERTLPADGTEEVRSRDLLELIDRVVFLSVPQWGTNIAQWVRDNLLGRAIVVAQLRTAVAASQVPVLNRIQDRISNLASEFLNLDLLRAVEDALREAQTRIGTGPAEVASAHEAAAALELWLRHMAWDFAAIDDLTPPPAARTDAPAAPAGTEPRSPAHFTPAMRVSEVERWRDHRIAIRSFATVSNRPYRFEGGKPAPRWDLLAPCSWPDLTPRTRESAGTDLAYRYCYRACAGGPFQYPGKDLPLPRPFNGAATRQIEVWDNDGIVNTASMLWPAGEETLLVECDHEDITGHFAGVRPGNTADREFRAYDLLGSASGFDADAFQAVWNDIFSFCHLRVNPAESSVGQASACGAL
jgi:hypothetical protein